MLIRLVVFLSILIRLIRSLLQLTILRQQIQPKLNYIKYVQPLWYGRHVLLQFDY